MSAPKPCAISFGTSKEKPSQDWLHSNLAGTTSFLFFETDTHSIDVWNPVTEKWATIGTFGKEK